MYASAHKFCGQVLHYPFTPEEKNASPEAEIFSLKGTWRPRLSYLPPGSLESGWRKSGVSVLSWSKSLFFRPPPALYCFLSGALGWGDPLEKEMAPHSSTLAWKIPWTEEPGRLQSMGSQRVGHDWATSLSLSQLSLFSVLNVILSLVYITFIIVSLWEWII